MLSLAKYTTFGFILYSVIVVRADASNDTSLNNATRTITTSTLTVNADGRVIGWVGQPNVRGALDIAWSSLFTIFICTYMMLCLNVPSEGETIKDIVGRRLFWMGIAIAGPEFVLTYASGQWGIAKG